MTLSPLLITMSWCYVRSGSTTGGHTIVISLTGNTVLDAYESDLQFNATNYKICASDTSYEPHTLNEAGYELFTLQKLC